MADSLPSSSLSKNQKKRARKKANKQTTTTEGGGGGGDGEGGRRREGEEEVKLKKRVFVDPMEEIKRKLEEAKINEDHEAAQLLRENLWTLRDSGTLQDTSAIKTWHSETARTIHDQSSSADPIEKNLSRLRKKLKQIDALKERQSNGEKLEANQLAKTDTEQSILEEIEEIEEIIKNTPPSS